MFRFRTRLAARGVRLTVLGAASALAAAILIPAPGLAESRRAPQTLSWVVLGDSYTAGVIETTGDVVPPRDGCARTELSYPERIRRDLGTQVSVRNVSCGGATIANITREAQEPLGRPASPLGVNPDAPFPPVPPQAEALSSDTDLITIGIGGNTAGFGPILIQCLTLGASAGGVGTPCRDKLAASLPERLEQVRAEYQEMLVEIHARAPGARVITVGYPSVIPKDVSSCRFGDPLMFATIAPGDLAWLRVAMLEPLNTIIEKATNADGGVYVDLYGPSTGHSVCDRAGGNNWIDGIVSDFAPLRYGFVHPNAKGQANAASLVEAALLHPRTDTERH